MTNGVVNGREPTSSARSDLAALALLALAVRLAWVAFGSWESGDSQWYIATAQNLVTRHMFSADGVGPTAFRPPLYSAVIASLWVGNSAPIGGTLMLQAILGTVTVALVYLIARCHFDRWVAVIAATGLALAPMTGRFTAVVLTETLFTFLLTLGIFFWARSQYQWTGIAFGLAMLTRVTLLPFVLLLPLLTLLRPWRSFRRAFLTIILLSLAVASVWIARNALVFHRFIPVAAAGSGTNLLVGSLDINEADDVTRRKALLKSVDTAGSTTEDETEFDRVRLRAALQRIKEHPGHWLLVRAQQYPRLFIDSGSYLFGNGVVPYPVAVHEGRLGQVVVRTGFIAGNLLVFLLALIGVVTQRTRFAELSHLTLFPLFLALVSLPLWIEPRYGLPMMPLIAILSAAGTEHFRR